MDRRPHNPEPLEPNDPDDQPRDPITPGEPTAEVPDRQPAAEAPTPKSDTPTRPRADAADSGEVVDESDRGSPRESAIAGPAASLPADRDTSERLPANLREQMRQDPVFTRQGWGVDDQDQQSDASNAADTDPGADEQNEAGERPTTAERTAPEETPRSVYADVVAEHDERWEATEANLPPGRLPESAKDLDTEAVERMDRGVRRLLEYQGAKEYIADNVANHPWLEPAVDASPAVQRIFTAIDRGGGHAHIRHGPMGDDQMYADRVARLEDPAQVDEAKRAAGIDGLNPPRMHRCGREATRIHDPEAFVVAFAAAVKLDEVQAALATPIGPSIEPPDSVKVPIEELLGPEGHKYCSGYRLEGGPEAWRARKDWVQARVQGVDVTEMPEPSATRIETFEGGNVIIRFKSNGQAYEIATLFVEPVADH